MDYVDIFKEIHLEVTGVPFIMLNGREGKSLKELYLSLNRFWIEKRGSPLSEEALPKAFRHFLESIDDPYIQGKFIPSIIYQSMQQILNNAYGKKYSKEDKKRIKAVNLIREYTPEELEEIAQIKRAYLKEKQ